MRTSAAPALNGWRRGLRGAALFWAFAAGLFPALLLTGIPYYQAHGRLFEILPGLDVAAQAIRWLIYLGGAAIFFSVLFPAPGLGRATWLAKVGSALFVAAVSAAAPLAWRHGYLPLAAEASSGTERVIPGRIVLVRECCSRRSSTPAQLELGFELQGEAGKTHIARFDSDLRSKHWSEHAEFLHWHPAVGDAVLVTVKRNPLGRSVTWMAPAQASPQVQAR